MQCDPLHIRGMAALVERMVDAGDQCRICSRSGSSDEATDTSSDYGNESEEVNTLRRASTSAVPLQGLKYKRSGELFNNTQAGVAKDIRFRRQQPLTRSGRK